MRMWLLTEAMPVSFFGTEMSFRLWSLWLVLQSVPVEESRQSLRPSAVTPISPMVSLCCDSHGVGRKPALTPGGGRPPPMPAACTPSAGAMCLGSDDLSLCHVRPGFSVFQIQCLRFTEFLRNG